MEDFIERSARSVLRQSYDNLEILFLDDHSSDNGLFRLGKIIEEFPEERRNQVQIVINETNLGLARARNKAVDLSTGDFIFWIDGDDFITADAIQLLVEKQQETGADIVTGKALVIKETESFETPMSCGTSIPETLTALLSSTIFPMLWGRLIRASLYKKHHVRALDGINYREDYQVFPKLVYYAHSLAELDEFIYYYEQGNSYSYNNLAKHSIQIRLNKDLQDLVSTEMIRDFFRVKMPELERLNEENVARALLTVLRNATRANDKRSFMKAASKYVKTPVQYIHTGKFLRRMARISPTVCWWMKRLHSLIMEPQLHFWNIGS